MFQFHYLLADFNALENVMMPALIGRAPEQEARERAERYAGNGRTRRQVASAARRVVGRRAATRRSRESGGADPRLVLADEPTGNLDPHTADEVHALFHKLNSELDVTLIVATHNERLTRSMGRALRLKDGKLFDEPRI